ncbi:MAG: hypothetical protein WD278_06755 [Pirellulales bacterium]
MQSVDQLCDQLASGDQVQAYQARRALDQLTASVGGPDKTTQRGEIAAALARALTAVNESKDGQGRPVSSPKYPSEVRSRLARTLADVAGDMEVPALAQALGSFETREMARWALDRMTCQAATDALVEAAQKAVGDEFRVGCINALARRKSSAIVEVLKQFALETNRDVRMAAAEALAEQADAGADPAIAAAAAGAPPRGRDRVIRARIRLAENLVRAGEKDAGKDIYEAVAAGDCRDAQKKAAKIGLEQLG